MPWFHTDRHNLVSRIQLTSDRIDPFLLFTLSHAEVDDGPVEAMAEVMAAQAMAEVMAAQAMAEVMAAQASSAAAMVALDGNTATANPEVEGGAAAAMVEHWSWTEALRLDLHSCIIVEAAKSGFNAGARRTAHMSHILGAQPVGVHAHILCGLGRGHHGQAGQPTSTCSLTP
ncbi:hypothetical protein ACQJBY_024202 [Aegilops geniculata]